VTGALLAVSLAATSVLAGCSDDEDDPLPAPGPSVETTEPTYDPSLEPAAAVLALVPDDATRLVVTDYDQIRLQLGYPDLSETEAPGREKYWNRVDTESAALIEGVLRADDADLRKDYGFSQDDVVWEAHFGNEEGVLGWTLKFRDDLDMADVQRAVDDEVGPLAGVTVFASEHVVGVTTTTDPDQSWAADPALNALVGLPATATYVERSCIPFDEAYGEGMYDQLASGPAQDLAALDDLGPFSVSFGGDLATARLGSSREDTFSRARIADTLPEGDPSFGEGFQRPVADPSGGRIGYALGDPRLAVELTLARRLPFALCAD
jgi:hypothetical protein